MIVIGRDRIHQFIAIDVRKVLRHVQCWLGATHLQDMGWNLLFGNRKVVVGFGEQNQRAAGANFNAREPAWNLGSMTQNNMSRG